MDLKKSIINNKYLKKINLKCKKKIKKKKDNKFTEPQNLHEIIKNSKLSSIGYLGIIIF
jgi:hypothetical protein